MSENVARRPLLDKVIDTIGELPASPAIVSSVMGLTANLDANVDQISKALASDQALTAKVLRLSNSSFYGRSKEVNSLTEAIMILGFFTVRSIVIATSTHRLYNCNDSNAPQSKLWRHTLATAVAARQIATHLRRPEKDEVFIAALLHDIGKLVMMQRVAEPFANVIERVEESHSSFLSVENEILGFNHCDVGIVLLQKWQFPDSLTQAIYRHHNLPGPDEDNAFMAYLINLGNCLAKNLEVGFSDNRIEQLSETTPARHLGLDQDTIDEIATKVAEHYQTEIRIFEES